MNNELGPQYKRRIVQNGSLGRQEQGIPASTPKGQGLGDKWRPKAESKASPSIKPKERLTPREEMMRRSAVINASTRALKVYTDENDNDPVIGLAAYFETDAYAENVESSGLSLEDFTKAVVARYELLKEIDAGRREGDTDIAKPQVD